MPMKLPVVLVSTLIPTPVELLPRQDNQSG